MICDGWQIPIQSEVRTDLKQAEGNFLPISLFISHDWRASTSSMFQSVDWYQAITHIKSDNGITSPWLGQSKIHIPWGTDTTSTTTTTSVTLEAEMQQTKHGVDFAATKSHKRDQTNDQKTFPKPNENIQNQTNTSTAPTPNFMCKKRVSPQLCRVATRTTWTLTVAGLLNGLTTSSSRGGITLIAVLVDAHVGLWGNGIPVYPNLQPISWRDTVLPCPKYSTFTAPSAPPDNPPDESWWSGTSENVHQLSLKNKKWSHLHSFFAV